MRVILKAGLLIVATETEAEADDLAVWRAAAAGHVFYFDGGSAAGGALRDLGTREEVCRDPLNIVFDQCDPRWQPISNLAHTPFSMQETTYASVEGFWQSLKFDDGPDRARVSQLWGPAAKRASHDAPESATVLYEGERYPTGGHRHHSLMKLACRAKFSQAADAQEALLATGERWLVHRTRRDSKTIPGALMADIWMRIRQDLRKALQKGVQPPDLLTDPTQIAVHDGRILFFARDRETYGFLSHFAPAPMQIDGETWPTVEHFYQAQKSFDPAYRAAIRACETPGRAKQLAARADPRKPSAARSWFEQNGQSPRFDWAQAKRDIMRRGDLAKFRQNPELAAKLLATGTADLVEDSPFEPFWGTGYDGAGQNWAGRILMEVRETLRPDACGT